ncbi:ArsR family transcriptional regulator [Micromonospora sp. PLK6-60]|uniref:arsenate reductase/protein-tyrosine-phosphatase family protein n=1 Tax=Micromonospora sp. PLK6-60 TaxID=2873383 RepID=UPI001CA6D47A|nr:ArsR family transcriptional regulator [Micromonospora sp. PLK6-60]MBY8870659.1 ArsR family transcriptional regulator [Micromonospora sp. PLK6-60]
MASPSRAAPAFLRLAAHPLRWRLLTVLAQGDQRVRDLTALLGEPQNLVSYHLRLLRDGGLLTATRSSFDGRGSYYHLDLDRCAAALADTGAALHPALRPPAAPPGTPVGPRPGVLFVCTGNSTRSPIAEALLRRHTDGRVEVASAGTRPRDHLHPNAVRVLREEFGTDVAGQPTRHVDTLTGRRFDYVISLCDRARETCPDFAGQPRRVHWSIPDPAATGDTDRASYPSFRRITAEIQTRVSHLTPVLTASAHPKEAPQ